MRCVIASFLILLAIVAVGCHPSSIFVPSSATINRCPDVSGVVTVHALIRPPGSRKPRASIGTAFVVHRDGNTVYAITCHHCIAGAAAGMIRVDNRPAILWADDAEVDLALLRWESWFPYRVYKFGTAERGQTVWAAGFPDTPKDKPGSEESGGCSLHVRRGTVSWIKHNMLGFDGGACRGFSGGPLLTSEGTVVGIVEMAHSLETIIGRIPMPSFTLAIRPKHAAPLIASIPP